MFFGEFEHQVDAKNRIRIPARLRQELASDYVFMRGTTKCISVYSKQAFDEQFGSIKNISVFDKEALESLTEVLSLVFTANEDGQGRVVLPEKLKKYAEIDKEITFVGMLNHIDIYAKHVRDEMRQAKSYEERIDFLRKMDK
ncbi:MAG: hypothetical protein IJW26_01295 [Clostridia bacterium]|nr:hypothetical protein [Clostridia bacterium]